MKNYIEKAKSHLKSYKAYYITYAVFLMCLFSSPHIYAFFDFHVSDGSELYEIDRRDWENKNPGEMPFMSFTEWQQKEDEHSRNAFEYICNESASLFDPWHEPAKFERDFGREE